MSKTTLDLSTLALTYGTHTVKVKAKADGYRDSEFSNGVAYVKEPVARVGENYTLHVNSSFTHIPEPT